MKPIDITALGEFLIDFTPKGLSDAGNYVFEANPGGAPCNVLTQATRLGKKTAFIGKVGTDLFGRFLKEVLAKENIDSRGLMMSPSDFTTLAFVALDKDGNRDFSFARNNSADTMLLESEVDEALIAGSKIFHCGTLSLTHENAKKATQKAWQIAKANGVCISVDPNLRMSLWQSEADAKAAMDLAMSQADILKISDYEVEFLCGEGDLQKNAKALYRKYNPRIMFVTCGKDGAFLLKDDITVSAPCVPAKTVDTTGAGDSFCGAALTKLLDYGLAWDKLDLAACTDILQFANKTASLSTEQYGAIAAMPTLAQVQ